MSVRSVLILEKRGGVWGSFLRDYLSDTPASISVSEESAQAIALFDKISPSVLFAEPCFLSRAFLQKIKVRKSTDSAFRVCLLGEIPGGDKEDLFDAVFQDATAQMDFNRHFAEILPKPECLKLLVVDDEEEIGAMVRDYFDDRRSPAFVVTCVANGKAALDAIARECPDVIILDIKMPVMDGREFYARMRRERINIPVIVFFDSISSEDLAEIRKCGNPAVAEKGCQGSSLAALLLLVKKLIYFGA